MLSLKSGVIIALLANVTSSQQEQRLLRDLKNKDTNENYVAPNPSPRSPQTAYPTYDYGAPEPLLVDHLYTYGAPSVTMKTHQSNPGNTCIPGIRTYTEDMTSKTLSCSWYEFWCNEASGLRSTNVDFASQINVGDGYMHPKMDILILRDVDGVVEYEYRRCKDSSYRQTFQWWPGSDAPSDMLPGSSIHNLDLHYEKRLMIIKSSVAGPMLDYASAARCSYDSFSVEYCLNTYKESNINNIPGVASLGYEVLAQMSHQSSSMTADVDGVVVLKNDKQSYRRCIIAFRGSDSLSDLLEFVGRNNSPTSYCGRSGIHSGIKNELWRITHDSQYASVIKPALETCHEVNCIGHSLGGSLCNLFTMCANQGEENLENMRYRDEEMWDDYYSLIWNKMRDDYW